MSKRRAASGGSVYQRSDGKWVAQVRVYDDLSGTSRKVRRYASSREQARALLKQLRNDGPVTTPTSRITLAEYLRQWSTERLPHTSLAPRTQRMYADLIAWYAIPAAGRIKLSDFGPAQAERWLAVVRSTRKRPRKAADGRTVQGEPISASTVRNTYNAVLKALDTAVRDRLIAENPLRSTDRPKSPRPRVPVTKAHDADRLLEAVEGHRLQPVVWFVMFTGCRIGEALALRWEDVDLDAGTARIHQGSLQRATTKTDKVRTVTLLPEVVEQLKGWRAQQRRERLVLGPAWPHDTPDLVFTSSTGRAINPHNSRRDLAALMAGAGLNPARPWHSLRHGLAHRLLQRGVPLHMVSAILGHSGIQITADTYGHVEATVPVEVLSEALGR